MENKKFKILIFIIATFFCCIFAIITFVAAAAIDEGTGGTGIITQACGKLFYIFRFPTHTLFFKFMSPSMFFIGLFINCLFYGLIIERLMSVINNTKP